MTKQEYLDRAAEWLSRAEMAHSRECKQLGLAAHWFASGTLAAEIAGVYATLALSAEPS